LQVKFVLILRLIPYLIPCA